MKDTLIINSISKIYFSIVSFFIFIFLTLSVTFLFLSSGVHFKNINFDSVRINKLYIKWNEKLNIHIKEINVVENNSKNSSKKFDLNQLTHLNKIVFLPKLVESIMIEKITYKDLDAHFIYTDDDGGSFNIDSKHLVLNSTISTGDRYFNLEIKKFKDLNKDIDINANIVVDSKQNKLYLNSEINVSNDISVNIDARSDINRLDYSIKSNKEIPSTSYLVSILDMDPRVVYWVDTAIEMDSLDIKQAYGFIDYKKPQEALTNFYAYAVANSLKYTYDQKLDSIKTKYTDLVFKDGVLFILPNSSKTYDFDLDASWLRIDFTKPQEVLTLHLLFDGMVNKNLKDLLEHYKIKLPFIQKSGYMDTNLILAINLISLDVDANGYFYSNNAMFNYLGLDLDLSDTYVKLHNFDVDIPKMKAKYKNIADANVSAKIDLKNSDGFIDFNFSKISFGNNFNLDTKDNKLHVRYVISKNKDKIKIDHSNWSLNKQKIALEQVEVPFNLDKLTAQIPTTELSAENILTSYISGDLDLKKMKFDLELDLIKLNISNVELAQSNVQLRALYEKEKLTLHSNDPISLNAGKQHIKLNQLDVAYEKGSIHAKSSDLVVENLLSSKFNISYSLKDKDGYLRLNNLNFNNDTLGKIFKKNNNIDFQIKSTQDQFIANSSSLNISAFISPEQWVVAFNSLDKIKPYSPFLRKYQVDKGTFSIYQRKDENKVKFLANIDYKYNLLLIDEKPISKYIIKGEVNNNNDAIISINDKVDLSITNDVIGIIGDNIGVNLNNIIELTNKMNNTNEKPSEFYITMTLDDSYIFLSDKRRVLADNIELQYLNQIITAQITHKNAEAGFKYKNKKFHLYGSGFNDLFMENLFAMSRFNGGSLDFSINGDIDSFGGVVFVKDTTIREFRLLNNVLAFVNTIPSLVTFSLPSYNTKGLHAKTAYMRFTYKNSVYDISDVSLNSNELDILGHGKTSIKNDYIDMELNLKTDLASSASKIPVVGYILFDKDSISTTVKIEGKLSEPDINSMLAKEIIVAPLNIIKRTLLLPFSIFMDDKKE